MKKQQNRPSVVTAAANNHQCDKIRGKEWSRMWVLFAFENKNLSFEDHLT